MTFKIIVAHSIEAQEQVNQNGFPSLAENNKLKEGEDWRTETFKTDGERAAYILGLKHAYSWHNPARWMIP